MLKLIRGFNDYDTDIICGEATRRHCLSLGKSQPLFIDIWSFQAEIFSVN